MLVHFSGICRVYFTVCIFCKIYAFSTVTYKHISPISQQFIHFLGGGLFVQVRMTSLVQIHTILAKSYVIYELPIRMNLYEYPRPNSTPKPIRNWGLDKLY